MLSDSNVGVCKLKIILQHPQVRLEGAKDAYIQWLESGRGMRWQSHNDNAVLNRILDRMNAHVALSIVHDQKDLIVHRTISLLMEMLKCVQKTFMRHPPTLMQEN